MPSEFLNSGAFAVCPQLYLGARTRDTRTRTFEVPEDLDVGPGKRGLMVRDAASGAEFLDQWLGVAKPIARQAREEVVFDLVVEPAVPEVDEPGDGGRTRGRTPVSPGPALALSRVREFA